MNLLIDTLALLLLLLYLYIGWRHGTRISLLRISQLISALLIGLLAGRYLGNAIGQWANRPRIVTMPALGLFAATLTYFLFHLRIHHHLDQRPHQLKQHNRFRNLLDRTGGILLSTLSATLLLTALLWLANLATALTLAKPLPGSQKSIAAQTTQHLLYQTAARALTPHRDAHHAIALANTLSQPHHTIQTARRILQAQSIQQLINNTAIGPDLLSADPQRIQNNPALQALFNDQTTLNHLRQLGLLNGNEKKADLCQQLATLAANPTIRNALNNLHARGLLHPDQLIPLIRDPELDLIIGEWLQ
jgi:uncharacterized membrane protein required for colicin V production